MKLSFLLVVFLWNGLSHKKDIGNLYDSINLTSEALLVIEADLAVVEGVLMTQESRLDGVEVDVAEIYSTTANLDVRIQELETLEAEIRAVYNKE